MNVRYSMWRLPVYGMAVCAVLASGCRNGEETPAPPDSPVVVATVADPPAATSGTGTSGAATAADAPPAAVAHDVTGAYFPMEKLPAEFSELDFLSLATIDENAAPAPLNGFLRPKKSSAQDYTLVNPSIEGNRLTFTTQTVGATQYAFTGTFALLHNFPENPPAYETAVLSGTLTKLRDGKTVAERPVKFRYEAGG